MVLGRTLQKALEKFFKSPVVQDARCQMNYPMENFMTSLVQNFLKIKLLVVKKLIG